MRRYVRLAVIGSLPGYLCLQAEAQTLGLSLATQATVLTTSQPVTLEGKRDVVITRSHIVKTPDNCVLLRNCQNVLIIDNEFGEAVGEGVHLINCTSVTVASCRFRQVRTGVYAVNCSGIRVVNNNFRNVTGPVPRGQFVQFNNVTGSGNCISGNIGINESGKSHAEDAINIYQSEGTAQDPIRVERNRIRGGGPSASGGGIMVGDSGGKHILVQGNQLVDPGQYGIAVAGGSQIQLLNNEVYGRQQTFTNVGLYVWNQSRDECSSVTVRGNRVWWKNKDGIANPAWNAGNCALVAGWDDNSWNDIRIVVPPQFPEVPM